MSLWSVCEKLEAEKKPFVIVTQVSSRGHVPQDPGAKAVVTIEGLIFGTVGGGKVEAKAIKLAQEKIAQKKKLEPEMVVWNLQRDVGMTCGGEVTFLFEAHFTKTWEIVVFGAGHVAQSVVRLLETLDCSITCLDSRQEWIDRLPNSEKIKKICREDLPSLVKAMPGDAYFLSLTQGHSVDTPILAEIFHCFPENKYIGVIGSDLKGAKIRQELLAKGIAPSLIEKLRCPMGLDIGTNHTGEIAVSIVAELLKVRDIGENH